MTADTLVPLERIPAPAVKVKPEKSAKPPKPTSPPLADHYKILAKGLRSIANNSKVGLARHLVLLTLKDQVVSLKDLEETASHLRWCNSPPSADVIRRAIELRYLEEVR